jgi:YceI-like domain
LNQHPDGIERFDERTMKGVTQQVPLDVTYLGQWDTPWWWEGKNLRTIRRAGWEARTRIDRRDFGISWNDDTAGGGIVVSSDIAVVLDVEAMRDEELERTGALDYYRQRAGAER